MEGPYDKVITFLALDQFPEDVAIPGGESLPDDLSYLAGHSLAALLAAEYQATAAALARMGRMSCSIHLPELSPAVVGEAMMFFQLATGYAGVWYGVNPFDQPGVELGKRLTFAVMGRPGFAADPVGIPAGDQA
jgi:glucose-6-phosphate isomerase